MFSALRFVAAGVIVALFGGFLLAGILTTPQGEEVAPAAVTASPSPMTSEELLAGMTAEQFEPGVHRVLDNDIASLSTDFLRVGPDGSVWLFGEESLLRLGAEGPLPWDRDDASGGADIAADGSVWMINHFDSTLSRFDGMTWLQVEPPDDVRLDSAGLVAVTADGSVWAGWEALTEAEDLLARWDGQDWQSVDPVVPCGLRGLHASDREIWYVSQDPTTWGYREGCPATKPQDPPALYRFDGSDWRLEPTPEGFMGDSMYGGNAIGPGDTIWVSVRRDVPGGLAWPGRRTGIARYDGTEWQEWSATDFPPEGRRNLVTGDFRFSGVSADGSLWGTAGAPDECDGLVRFDGTTATHYLEGRCIQWGGIDIGPDGAAWVLGDAHELYVIRPQAAHTASDPGRSAEEAVLTRATTKDSPSGMVAEEVEPGVYRVIDDGVRNLTVPPVTTDPARLGNIVAGLDGSVWLFLSDRFFRLGDEDQVAPGWQLFWPDADIEITSDGSVWAIARREDGSAVLVSFSDRLDDGATMWGESGWPEDRSLSDWADRYYLDVAVQPEGNVLAAWHQMLSSGTPDRTGITVERDIGGWVALWPSLMVDPEDHAWWLGSTGDESADGLWLVQQHGAIYRSGSSGSSEWRIEDCPFGPDRCGVRLFDVGLDGTVWVQTEEERSLGTDDVCGLLLARFDGTDWEVWGPEDGVPAVGPARFWGGCQEGVHVAAPDGSVWLAPPGHLFESSLLDGECTGIANFDGTTWSHYLDGVCVHDASVAPDGAVWLQGGRPYGLYVITPEAVAAAG